MPALNEEVIEDQIDDGPEPEVVSKAGVEAEIIVPPKDEEWKTALAALTANVTKLATPAKPAPVAETEDQRNERWAVFQPEKTDPKFFHKLFNLPADASPETLDAVKQAWGLMQNGLMKQAIVGATNVFEHKYGDRLSRIDALEEWRSQASAKELRTNFNESFPALADPIYNDIIKLAANELANRDFADHAEYFKALAERAAVTIKSVKPDFDLGAVKTTKTTGRPTLPRTRVGGTGGSGGGGKTAPGATDDDSGSLEM